MPDLNILSAEALPYRQNVAMVVFNRAGEVLVGERLNLLGAWQFPQGGIDDGEDPLAAAQRELYEELGIADATLVAEYPDWLHYDFPDELRQKGWMKHYRGQIQRWFLFYWDHPAAACNLDAHEREFATVQFVPIEAVTSQIVEFKRAVYDTATRHFAPLIADYVRDRAPS